ncbi:hypothetical protein [Actinoplanes sp. NPDC051494]|uniref:hypothetical protein n=1 Tax=Actinoplanes sp. NPDC051494 TaxID=3363907 RepID=UPI003788FB25
MKKLLISALAAAAVLAPFTISSAASAAAADPILAGKRQVVIAPLPSFESIVGIDGKGRLHVTDGEPKFSLFVLSPVGKKFQIKTAKAGDGKKAACIGLKNNGSKPVTAVATTCNTKRAGQLFTITKLKAKDNGRPTYSISNGGAFLQYFPKTGLIVKKLGGASLKTSYAFVDNGPAPKLG